MWFHSLLPSGKSGRSRGRRPQPRPARRGTRLVLEQLEDRSLPSSYSAATVSDLIADINAANAAAGANTITLAAKTTSPYILTAVNNDTGGVGSTGLPVIAANDNLTIVGNGDTIERSTASGTPDFRLLDVASGGSLTLENLTLQGGLSQYFGGGAIYNGGTLVLNGVTVQRNLAYGGAVPDSGGAGGGIYSGGGSVTLEGGTIVRYNQAGFLSSGLDWEDIAEQGYGGGLYAQNSAVTVSNATLDNNTAIASDAEGGGLYAYNSTVTVTNATVDNNTAYGSGASVNSFTLGGGLCAGGRQGYGPCTVTVTNSTLDNNVAEGGEGGGLGGGLCLEGGTVTLSGDTVNSNKAHEGGGLCVEFASATLTNDTVESNSGPAVGGCFRGGGLYLYDSTATLTSDTVEFNSAKAGGGGGLYLFGSTATLTSDTVQSNTTTGGSGGGIYIVSRGTVYLDSFTVANTINNTDSSGLNGSTANIDGTYILQNP